MAWTHRYLAALLPGGALPVAGGDEILEPIAKLMESNLFKLCVATQDWHPRDHASTCSDLTRSVYPESDDGIRESLERRGVETLTSDWLVA